MAARKKAAPAVEVEAATDVPAAIAANAIQPIPFGRLKRAPENVRKTNIAADVESLADDIAAHGLLQSLIGYAGDTSIDKNVVWIVGGGRRLQALELLHERGMIGEDFPVSVLLRAAEDAVELSLSENLARRDMNPADEFDAFAALMKPGSLSPEELAKRFGFTERYVKQRLRLSALHPDILDALREGKMTLDGAMAYAKSSDHETQMKVFRAQAKSNWKPHDPAGIAQAYINAQMTTDDPLFKFVTAKDYERKGGDYEDDLFGALAAWQTGKRLKHPTIVLNIAGERAVFQLDRLKAEAKAEHPTTIDVLLAPGIRHGKLPKVPAGCKLVERDYNVRESYAELRDRAVKVGALITGVAHVDSSGKLVLDDRFFVPADKLHLVMPPREQRPMKSQAEIEAERRRDGIRSVAAILAAEELAAAKTKGRQFYNSTRPYLGRVDELDGLGEVYAIPQTYYVTPAEVDAKLVDAEAEYDRQEVAKRERAEAAGREKAAQAEALAARKAELLAMEPPPAAIEVDGEGDMLVFFQWESGMWCEVAEAEDAEPDYGFDDLAELLEWADVIGRSWPTLDAYRADVPADAEPVA